MRWPRVLRQAARSSASGATGLLVISRPRLGQTQTLQLPDGRAVPFAVMDEAAPGAGVVGYVNHPSSGGYSYQTWCPVVAGLLELARSRCGQISPQGLQ